MQFVTNIYLRHFLADIIDNCSTRTNIRPFFLWPWASKMSGAVRVHSCKENFNMTTSMFWILTSMALLSPSFKSQQNSFHAVREFILFSIPWGVIIKQISDICLFYIFSDIFFTVSFWGVFKR